MNEPDAGRTSSLRRANVGAAVLHAVQAAAVLALATDFALPVTASYWQGRPVRRRRTPWCSSTSPLGSRSRGS